MELATNTFNKGLLMDTNPMVQGNDSLTDCLNGTIITMNGNEAILLNDMGNRRVNNAYLPSGYEPVGIKEYGGIIYVASYNPITNKSLIGSFPSPLRKIDSFQELGNEFNFGDFFENIQTKNILGVNLKFLNSDTFLIPLTKNNVLHAGDKFAIYANGLSNMKYEITNYDNIDSNYTTKAKSPKNRKYTLLVGILNSQNEFVDITKTLGRWKNNVLLSYDSSYSEVYKLNDGYFISDEFNAELDETIEDSKLIRTRLKLAANTYAYKLIGPLYLKATLNHIENFNYNIYGIYDDGKATLWIEGYITYNCPDEVENIINNSNEDYSSFDEGVPQFNAFDLWDSELRVPTEEIRSNSIYNPNTNTYTTKIVKKYENIEPNNGENIYDFFIGVESYDLIYIKNLSVESSIDLSLLGSGKVFVTGWKFYNNLLDKSSILTFSINAYPEYGKEFSNLRMLFLDNENTIYYPKAPENVTVLNNIPLYNNGLPMYNGRQTVNIDWEEIGLEPRKLYQVNIFYDINEETKTLEDIPRWFLTTELFNDFYSTSKLVDDFCKVETNPNSENYNAEFAEKLIIKIEGKGNLSTNIKKLPDEFLGGLISNTNEIKYICKHSYKLDVSSIPTLSIINEDLYPDNVSINPIGNQSLRIKSAIINKIGDKEISTQDYNNELKKVLTEFSGDNVTTNTENLFNNTNVFEEDLKILNLVNERRIYGNINFYDVYAGYNETPIKNIKNVFDSFYNIVEDAKPWIKVLLSESLVISNEYGRFGGARHETVVSSNTYGGVVVDKEEHSGGSRDDHWLKVYTKLPTFDFNGDSPYYNDNDYMTCIAAVKKDSGNGYTFDFIDYEDSIYDKFSNNIFKGQMFIFMCPLDNTRYVNDKDRDLLENNNTGKTSARVWWRTSDGNWAMFKNLYTVKQSNNTTLGNVSVSDSNFIDYIKNTFNYEYIYCMYDEYTKEIENLHATEDDFKYYEDYEIPINYTIDYDYNLTNLEDIINVGNKIGNFKLKSPTNVTNVGSDNIKLILKSSEEFLDNVRTFRIDEISGVYLENGLQRDSDGNLLDRNSLYYKYTNLDTNEIKLIKVRNSNILVDFDNKIVPLVINDGDSRNTLVYKEHTPGIPNPRYDKMPGSSDGKTFIDYNGTNVVSNI